MSQRFYFDHVIMERAAYLRRQGAETLPSEVQNFVYIPDLAGQKPDPRAEGEPAAVFVRGDDAGWLKENSTLMTFLGIEDGTAYYGGYIAPGRAGPRRPSRWIDVEDLRRLATAIDNETAGYLAYARALAHWNRNHLYCGRCGAVTESRKSGHERLCTNDICGRSHFPRTDHLSSCLSLIPTKKNACSVITNVLKAYGSQRLPVL